MTKVFILGAADPEMEEIERVVRSQGHEVRHARYLYSRVWSEKAYNATSIDGTLPRNAELIFVECSVLSLTYDVLVDHHHPGDPGYGRPPSEYLESSSLGQVLRYLGLEPTQEQKIIAAADHCPTQAYQGQCPGVSPEDLARWRTESRAARRGMSPAEMEQAIKSARTILESAERIEIAGQLLPWVGDRQGEIKEASARFNLPFLYAEPTRDGRTKMGIMGAAPQVIATWMRDCGLTNVYGDPARGFAGGYC